MLKIPFIMMLLFGLHGAAGHPLHVSVLNITLSDGKAHMELRTFKDDWEVAYFHFTGKQVDFSKPEVYRGSWFLGYLENALKIKEGEQRNFLSYQVDTVQFEDQSMIIEMHAGCSRKVKTLYLYNTLLTDVFPDQSNLAIISDGQKERGIKFDYRKREAEMKLN